MEVQARIQTKKWIYKIDIYDILKAATAYVTQGTGVPDKNWLPGADVAPWIVVIDIFDIVL